MKTIFTPIVRNYIFECRRVCQSATDLVAGCAVKMSISMKLTRTIGICLAISCAVNLLSAATLQIQITPKVSGENLQPASLRYQTSSDEKFSVSRVTYPVSDFELQRDDGSWLAISNSVAWLDFDANRDSIHLKQIPPGEFRSVRFIIGLNTNLNHADPAQFPAAHPLNPNLDGLNWSWQGGYI